jgi:cytoskeletal protein CcmA (bactofilin family)
MWRKSDESKQNSPGASPSPNPAPQQSSTAAQSSSSSALVNVNRGIKIKGEISGQGDFLIDGEFEGKVHLPDGTFTVGPNASVTADIEAREIVIHGEMVGTLKAHERVHIWSTGKLTGNMETRGIAIEDGAVLHSKVAVPHAAPRVATPPPAAQKIQAPQPAAAPKAAAPEAALPAAPASEVSVPEVLPEAKPAASPEVLNENDQATRAEVPPRAKRAAASTSPPASKES